MPKMVVVVGGIPPTFFSRFLMIFCSLLTWHNLFEAMPIIMVLLFGGITFALLLVSVIVLSLMWFVGFLFYVGHTRSRSMGLRQHWH